MKVKLFTEGGASIGLGHISRCISLYDEVVANGIDAHIYIYGNEIETNMLYGRHVSKVDWFSEVFLTKSINKNDYCIVDSYLANKRMLKLISEKAKKVVFLDDDDRLVYPKGIVINPSFNTGDLTQLKNSANHYLWGHEYCVVRQSFLNSVKLNHKIKVDRVTITMGGSDMRNLTPTIMKTICVPYAHIVFDIIIGATFNQENIKNIKEQKTQNVNLYYDVNEDAMRDILFNADFVITAAGQTVYELLALNVPFIPIKIADNQTNNIDSLHKHNLIERSITYTSKDYLASLRETFKLLLERAVRLKILHHNNRIIDGDGTKRIVDVLLTKDESATFLRRASVTDCDLLFNWANDKSVRRSAFKSEKIEYSNHRKWFYGKLKNKNTLMYIVMNQSNAVGQIRVDVESGKGMIDYSIDSAFRGLGIGKQAIKILMRVLCINQHIELNELIGRVKFDNIPSQKVFEGLGFTKSNSGNHYEYRLRINRENMVE